MSNYGSLKKRVSVIVTTFNSEKTIDRILTSIFNQDFTDELFSLEVIVVDDCSSDRTLERVKNYNVITLKTPYNSGGPNLGRNMGLEIATGDAICIVDHDDEWLPHKLATQLPYLNHCDIVSSGYILHDTHSGNKINRINSQGDKTIHYKKNHTFIKKLTKSKKGQNIYLGSLLYSSKLKNIQFEEQHGMLDFDWGLKIFKDRTSIEVCEALYCRHVFGQNLSLNEDYRKIDYEFSFQFVDQYAKEYPQEVEKAKKRLNGSRARYFFVTNNMPQARTYFKKSELNLRTILYYCSTYFGHKLVNRYFNVFG